MMFLRRLLRFTKEKANPFLSPQGTTLGASFLALVCDECSAVLLAWTPEGMYQDCTIRISRKREGGLKLECWECGRTNKFAGGMMIKGQKVFTPRTLSLEQSVIAYNADDQGALLHLLDNDYYGNSGTFIKAYTETTPPGDLRAVYSEHNLTLAKAEIEEGLLRHCETFVGELNDEEWEELKRRRGGE